MNPETLQPKRSKQSTFRVQHHNQNIPSCPPSNTTTKTFQAVHHPTPQRKHSKLTTFKHQNRDILGLCSPLRTSCQSLSLESVLWRTSGRTHQRCYEPDPWRWWGRYPWWRTVVQPDCSCRQGNNTYLRCSPQTTLTFSDASNKALKRSRN